MNKNRLAIGFAFALLLAFAASAFVYHAFRQAAAAPAAVAMQHIVVAAEPLPLGTPLDASKLRTIAWPASEPVTGMFTKVEDVTNRAVITNVAENEPILEAKLAPREAGAGLPATIPAGMRALSVAVNDVIGVAGFVTPGTMVDVLVTGTIQGQAQATSTVTRTILENVRVLAAGQKMQQDRDGKPETVPVITLLVAPEDAGKLAMASTEGKIQLALRNTVDVKATSPAPVLESVLFAGGEAPAPEKPVVVMHKVAAPPPPPPSPFTVEVISGGKRETKSFPNQ
ncbi:MAG TPA: Flp pilus assembly protein CpaB [Candidatus Acidoferrales bacterium]|nr:Flp pilus assembly protein CpaB [Candidatus Acidoferrales bacterium]